MATKMHKLGDSGVEKVMYHRFPGTEVYVCCILMSSGAGVIGSWHPPSKTWDLDDEDAFEMAYDNAAMGLDTMSRFLTKERRWLGGGE